MTTQDAVVRNFLKWCTRQQWNWMVVLYFPASAPVAAMEQAFQQWIGEIERADGTLGFRWVRFFITQQDDGQKAFHVLVGGLSSGEWWWWTRRWHAICGDPLARAGREYPQWRKRDRLRPVLSNVLIRQKFEIAMQIGAKAIQRRRTMAVDDDGIPSKRARRVGSGGIHLGNRGHKE